MDGTAVLLYFDHNATSPICAAARDAWLDAVEKYPANPSSPHRLGARADRALQSARERLAAILGCRPEQVIWTSGATESNNLLIQHFAASTAEAWVSAIEHPSVLAPASKWFSGRLRLIPVSRDGVVELGWIEEALRTRKPAYIAVMAANNETGVVQPWEHVSELCRQHDVPYLCDASQALGKIPVSDLGKAAYVTGCGHKFGGIPGVGFAIAQDLVRPLLTGGEQEDGQRAGTENVSGVLGTVAGLESRIKPAAARFSNEQIERREGFTHRVCEAIPETQVVGGRSCRLWNTVSLILPLADCRQRWVVKLDKAGVAASTGSACASGKERASHVLTAMGYSAAEASRAVRFSSGWETSGTDWDALANHVIECAASLG